jgi:UDP-glucose 4-epimerase
VVGCGFIGSRLASALVAEGIPTTVLTRTAPPPDIALALAGARLLTGNATDRFLLQGALEGVDHVVYAAGSLFPGASTLLTRASSSELSPLLSLLDSLRHNSRPTLTFISSGGAVYGMPERLPVDEAHPTNPISSYGIIKLAGERHALAYSRHYGFGVRVLRVSNVYGPGQRPDRGQGVVASFLNGVLTGVDCPLYGDGSVVRDFIHIDDLMAAIVDLLRTPQVPLLLNIGSGVGVSLQSLAAVVEEVTGSRLNLSPRPARPVDVPRIVLDVTLLRRTIDHDVVDLATGIGLTWRAMRGSFRAAV